MLNRQMVFDNVVQALYTQGEKSFRPPEAEIVDGGDICLYRKVKEDGTVLKCAAGHLIPDENYDPTIDENYIRIGKKEAYSLIDKKYGEVNIELHSSNDDRMFLNSIQVRLHDGINSKNFRDQLLASAVEFAKEYKLEYNKPS